MTREQILEKALRLSVMQHLEAVDDCGWCPLGGTCPYVDDTDLEYCVNELAGYWKRRAEQGDDVV